MIGATATATEMQNNFGHYLRIVMGGEDVIITRNGKEVGRLVPRGAVAASLTDSLTGILSGGASVEQAREEALRDKYAADD